MAGHVFLAYSRADRAYAQKLVEYLSQHDVPLWTDSEIMFGSNWASMIQQQIDTAAAVIVVMTPAGAESEWVQREIEYARHGVKPLFPLLVAGQPFSTLRDLQFDDVTGGRMPSQQLIGELRRLAGAGPSAPTPPPRAGGPSLVDKSATKVFISYRRSDTAFAAHWLHQELADWFRRDGGLFDDAFFIDVDSINPGRRFKDAVEAAIRQCQVLLVVIGDRWLGAEADGVRRLDAANDMVRQEIELGIEHGVTIVPILVHPATMPQAEQLPESIRELTEFQGMSMQAERFRDSAQYLAEKLRQIIGG